MLSIFSLALSHFNDKAPEFDKLKYSLTCNLEIILLSALALMFSLTIALVCFNARVNYFGILWGVLSFIMALTGALSFGYIYYIFLFTLFSLAELYLLAQYYILYSAIY